MIIIFGALKIELDNILRSAAIHRTFKDDGIVIHSGTIDKIEVLIVPTGMGKYNAAKAARIVCTLPELKKTREVKALITGFCGAADKELKVGDLVVYKKVMDLSGGYRNIMKMPSSHIMPKIYDNRKNIPLFKTVACGCMEKTISTPEEKKYIYKKYGAGVIDMESYWIVDKLLQYGLPPRSINCIRVVSDDSSSRLPLYFSSKTIFDTVFQFLISIFKSIFLKNEFKTNLRFFRNIIKARQRIDFSLLYKIIEVFK